MLVAAGAVLLPLDALRVQALVLRGEVVAALTLGAAENDLVARHDDALCQVRVRTGIYSNRGESPTRPYAKIFVTTPAPTVRPPSRMAKRSCSSMATGVMSSIVIGTLSPGITISVPSGSSMEPVTSVVRR